MATKEKFFTTRKVRIDGILYPAGADVSSLPEARLNHLRGRFVESEGDMKQRVESSRGTTKKTSKAVKETSEE